MKILFINSVCGVGSTGRICTDLYDEFKKNGYDCCIAYGRGTAPENYKTYKIGNFLNVMEHVCETRLFDNHGFSSRRATKKFIDFIEKYNPDIISLHNVHGYFLNLDIICEYLSKTEAKIFWTLHDGWLFSGHGAHPSLDSKGMPLPYNIHRREKKEYPKSYIDKSRNNYKRKKNSVSKINTINFVTPSIWLKEVASKSYLEKYSFKVINNGIDLEKFYAEKKDETDKKVILGVANIWDESKGINIFNDLVSKIDNEKFHIILVGDVKKKLKEEIKVVSKTNSQDELRRVYNTAKYFVNPTFNDTFPTVNIEALACGIPVITFNTGGSPEIIDDRTGIVLNDRNVESIMEVLDKEPFFSEELCVARGRKFDKKEKNREFLNYVESIIDENL